MAEDWLPLLENIAEAVQREAMPFFGKREVVGRGAGGDLTERIDAIAENAIIRILDERNISCILVSEEIGTKTIGDSPLVYIVADPIDGTLNAIRGIPFFATSIAVSTTKNLRGVIAAVVMDLYNGTLFTAEKGRGSQQNGEGIHSSKKTDFKGALIAIDSSAAKSEQSRRLEPLIETVRHPRHLGADALELCYVANGLYEAFVDIRQSLRVTDIAAAYLIIKEAGGMMVTLAGQELDAELTPTTRVAPFIAAGNRDLFEKIRSLIKC